MFNQISTALCGARTFVKVNVKMYYLLRTRSSSVKFRKWKATRKNKTHRACIVINLFIIKCYVIHNIRIIHYTLCHIPCVAQRLEAFKSQSPEVGPRCSRNMFCALARIAQSRSPAYDGLVNFTGLWMPRHRTCFLCHCIDSLIRE